MKSNIGCWLPPVGRLGTLGENAMLLISDYRDVTSRQIGMTRDASAKAAPRLIGGTGQRPLSGTVHLDSHGGSTNLPGSPNVAPGRAACIARSLAQAKRTPGLAVGFPCMQLLTLCVCWSIRGLLRTACMIKYRHRVLPWLS
jgi:hypothetical protein